MANSAPVEIDGQNLFPRNGIVEGGVARKGDRPEQAFKGFFLADGQSIDVEYGKALLVNVGGLHWERVQFFEGGRLVGPIIYLDIDPESPEAFLRASRASKRVVMNASHYVFGGVSAALVPALLGAIAYFGDLPVSASVLPFLAVIVAAGLGLAAFGVPTVWRYVRACRKGGQFAVDFLQKVQGGRQHLVPLGPISRDSLA